MHKSSNNNTKWVSQISGRVRLVRKGETNLNDGDQIVIERKDMLKGRRVALNPNVTIPRQDEYIDGKYYLRPSLIKIRFCSLCFRRKIN